MLTEEQLQEAAQILRKRDCRKYGHDYDVQVHYPTNMPTGIRCKRCDEYWRVFSPVNTPTQVISTIDATTKVMPRLGNSG